MQHDQHQLIILVERVFISRRPQSKVYPLPSVDVDPQQRWIRRKELAQSARLSE